MRIGIVGYGTGGRHFHAPFIIAAKGVELAGIVARAPATVARVNADYPGLPVHASLAEMLASGVDAVTITTPPATRFPLVMEAIAAGVHVVADKPFAPSAEIGRQMEAAAAAKCVVLGVFHNRRFDTDVQTLKTVLHGGRLGRLWRVESRMEQDDPATLEHGPEGGLLRDLGSHMVDQMLWLLGPVRSVSAHLDMVDLPEGPTDAGFVISMRHHDGTFSQVSASKLNQVEAKEYRVYGAKGSYLSAQSDVQAQAIFADRRPADDLAGWGYEEEARWGVLATGGSREAVPSQQGRYHDYYEGFARAVRDGTPPPVTPAEAIAVLEVLDAARQSAREGREILL